MSEPQEKAPSFVQKPANSYVIDAESIAEMGRLINQDRLVTEAMGGLFPADINVRTIHTVLDRRSEGVHLFAFMPQLLKHPAHIHCGLTHKSFPGYDSHACSTVYLERSCGEKARALLFSRRGKNKSQHADTNHEEERMRCPMLPLIPASRVVIRIFLILRARPNWPA